MSLCVSLVFVVRVCVSINVVKNVLDDRYQEQSWEDSSQGDMMVQLCMLVIHIPRLQAYGPNFFN